MKEDCLTNGVYMKKRRILVALVVALLYACPFLPAGFAVDAGDAADAFEAANAINEANLNLNSAFVAVAVAEDAGADVEGFLAKLDAAGNFLSEARLAYRDMNYEAASSLAAECNNGIEGLASEASYLMTKTKREKTDNLILTVVGSSIGLILLAVLGSMGWLVLKGRYYRSISEMKPEVEES